MGTAILQAHDTWYFHADPNSINVNHLLKSKITNTAGGKNVQILGINWDNLSLDFDSGSGGDKYSTGREYMRAFGDFFKDAMIWQRDTRQPCTWTYPPRNWMMSIYLDSVTIKDELTNVRFPFTMRAKIQQDLLGTLKTEAMSSALSKLTDGIGWFKNGYNYSPGSITIAQDQAVRDTYGQNVDGGLAGGI